MKYIKKYDLLDGIDNRYVHNELVLDLFERLNEVKERDDMIKSLVPF